MSTLVLVHGAWHGGWCWRHVAPLLRDAGHEVHHPTLTGLGERSHLRAPLGTGVGLDTHIQDVVNVLDYEDLREVVLVGHSYAGMVITGVADRVADRIRSLVYLDAFVPTNGQSLFDISRPERREMFQEQARQHDGLVPSPPPQAFGVTDTAAVNWVAARLGPQPLRTFEQPLTLRSDPETAASPPTDLPRTDLPRTDLPGTELHCTYLHCTRGPTVPTFEPFAARARTAPGWDYRELPAGHDAMITDPRELAGALSAEDLL